jgi:hypothetical protein
MSTIAQSLTLLLVGSIPSNAGHHLPAKNWRFSKFVGTLGIEGGGSGACPC